MTLRDMLRKKHEPNNHGENQAGQTAGAAGDAPEFKFVRTTTSSFETIDAPGEGPKATVPPPPVYLNPESKDAAKKSKSLRFPHIRKHSKDSEKSDVSSEDDGDNKNSNAPLAGRPTARSANRISAGLDKLHIRSHSASHGRSRSRSRSRSGTRTSSYLPADLPPAPQSTIDPDLDAAAAREVEALWERRATALAQDASTRQYRVRQTGAALLGAGALGVTAIASKSRHGRSVSSADGDEWVQEAIRLHETGGEADLRRSTAIFARLASPQGDNNAFAQVMYGLCLRHGWGCEASPEQAVKYLARAAGGSAAVEREALDGSTAAAGGGGGGGGGGGASSGAPAAAAAAASSATSTATATTTTTTTTTTTNKAVGGQAKGELILAIYELANCFRHGWGVDKDAVAARAYYEVAANLGDVDAMVEVAGMEERGEGGHRDKAMAARWLRVAERKGRKEVGNSWIWKEKYGEAGKPKAP